MKRRKAGDRKRAGKRFDPARAVVLCDHLRGFDHGLMELVDTCQGDLGRKVAGELVAMHRKLRRMRYEIEADAGI